MIRAAETTEQIQAANESSHAQRMQTIGQLVGSVAHDFNNILTAIGGFCDLLFLRHTPDDPSFANILQIQQSADRASALVRRLLAFSRKQTLKPKVLSLQKYFVDFGAMIQRMVGADMQFKQDIDPNTWNILADPVQMEQVMLNLAVNAHHAMKAGDTLSVKTYNISLRKKDSILKEYLAPPGEENPPKGDYVAIEVKDTGSGIQRQNIMHIFEPFFTTKSEKTGTGLGLSTVYGIIRQSEGYVYVNSKIGEGTTFLILFKRHTAPEESQNTDEEDEVLDTVDTSGNGVIVLIEDEDSVRLFAKSVLENKGYDVIQFSSAKEALENKEKYIKDARLIISDVVMPELTGPAFIKEIKKDRPRVKVLFMSGYGEEAFAEEYGSRRNFHFIPKPFSLKELANKVKEVL